ncbi:MAG: hypothetical protein R3E53_00015 [Myxococcota bacterium]
MKTTALIVLSFLLSALPLGFLLADGIRGDGAASTRPSAERKVFSHADHVLPGWYDDETKRDCQVCHDYEKGIEPATTCTICHADTMAVEGSVAEEKRAVDGARPEWAGIASFAHQDHLGLKCGDCHVERDAAGRPTTKKVYENIPIPKGLGFCVDCHDPKATSSLFAEGRRLATGTAQANANFQRGINAAPGMTSTGNEPFLHADHMTAAELAAGDLRACNVCHERMGSADAKPQIGEDLFRAADCAQCHKASADAGLDVAIKVDKEVPSGSDYTFFHKDHVTPEALRKMATYGSGDGCFKCHEYRASGAVTDEYPLKKDYEKFPTCVACHEAARSEKPTIRRPIDDHGEVDNCYGCHTVGLGEADLDMKTNRPMRDAKRRHPGDWRFRAHAHPHVTGSSDIKAKECALCHVSERPELPSRLKQKAFVHGPHLGVPISEQGNDACAECHTPQPKDSFMELATADGGALNYVTSSCMECHREVGAKTIEPLSFRKADASVVLFDHADHLKPGPDGKPLSCAECHQHRPGANGELEFAYADGVISCLACHDHGPEHFQQTGKVDQAYVETCMDCHVVGVPERGAPLFLERHVVEGLRGTQWHPLPTDQGCAECHKNTDANLIAQADLSGYSRVFGTKNQGFHTVVPQATPCYGCHWHDRNRWSPNTTKPDLKATRQQFGGSTNPIK